MGTVGDSAWVVAWGAGGQQVVSVAVMLGVGVGGGATLQAVAQGQVTASPPAVAHSRGGVKVLPATPRVPATSAGPEWMKGPQRAHVSPLNISREPCGRLLMLLLPVLRADPLRPPQDMLMQLAKAVASAAAALVLKAKNVAQKTEDSALQTQVIAAATQCALSTSQLVACTKVSSKVNPHLGVAASVTRLLAAPQCVGVPGPHVLRWDIKGLAPEVWAASSWGPCHCARLLNILFGRSETGDSCPCTAPTRSPPCSLPSLFPPLQVVAPTISSPVCQEQLIEAGKLVAKSAEGCVEASKAATNDDQLLKQVGVAATAVTQALNDLLQHIKQHALGGQPIGRYDQATDTILNVTENIFSSMGDAGESG